MAEWFVPIRIVEIGRVVRIEATTKSQARAKARTADWIECSEADQHIVTISGKVEKAD